MKVRTGFVSNSSSSSFVVLKAGLSQLQIDSMLDKDIIRELAEKHNMEYSEDIDGWSINDDGDRVNFYTSMDNFYMGEFLTDVLHVPGRNISGNYK